MWSVQKRLEPITKKVLEVEEDLAMSKGRREGSIGPGAAGDDCFAFLLGKFSMVRTNQQMQTAMLLKCTGFDPLSGTVEFVPTGYTSFGIWLRRVGYLPTSITYHTQSQFEFSPTNPPNVHFWSYHPGDSRGVLIGSPFDLPTSRTTLCDETGDHTTVLGRRKGIVTYRVEGHRRVGENGEECAEGDVMATSRLISVKIRPEMMFRGLQV
ncbi:hypothetical protein HK104_009572 [Borealophlyctis nickersoniae]|nr:hypothetical protein HK104_009572 [Borealophlyctis nickersoniae]